jgi:hypothetical protein
MLPEHQAHLCAVRALAAWAEVSGISKGYLFRPVGTNDMVSVDDIPMVGKHYYAKCPH